MEQTDRGQVIQSLLVALPMVSVLIVRHGCAWNKHLWTAADRDRPLTETGLRQAVVIADHYTASTFQRILSSPMLRCRQTVEPLALRLGLDVEDDERLRRDATPTDLRAAAMSLDADGVICTHGELMRPLLAAFRESQTTIRSARHDDDWLLAKGTGWMLTIGRQGQILTVDHEVPPGLPPCRSESR